MKVILFDGYCNLCSTTIDFVQKYDTNNIYSLIALQSEDGQAYLKKYGLDTTHFDTVVLIENNQVYLKSTAVLMILKNLTGAVRYLSMFIIIPEVIRDYIYTLIANNRFTLFGKRKTCKIK